MEIPGQAGNDRGAERCRNMFACFYIRGEQVKHRRGMTCKGIKREVTCELAFDTRSSQATKWNDIKG